jgi:hypothetical protein
VNFAWAPVRFLRTGTQILFFWTKNPLPAARMATGVSTNGQRYKQHSTRMRTILRAGKMHHRKSSCPLFLLARVYSTGVSTSGQRYKQHLTRMRTILQAGKMRHRKSSCPLFFLARVYSTGFLRAGNGTKSTLPECVQSLRGQNAPPKNLVSVVFSCPRLFTKKLPYRLKSIAELVG